ncbi:hypothetical protein DL98DRAFT_589933 [Cadophora sp. DSE1049]|nr:hypothetical protein DL98DRAFT_589933 [Cadophora sp. DSE1049]
MTWIVDHCQRRDRDGDLSASDKVNYQRTSNEVDRLVNRPKNDDGTSTTFSPGDMERVRAVQRGFVNGLMARIIRMQFLGYITYLEMNQQKGGSVVPEEMEILVGLSKGVGPFLFKMNESAPSISQEIAEALHDYFVRMVSWKMDADEKLVLIVEMMIEKAKEQGTVPEERTASLIKPSGVSSEYRYGPKWEDVVWLERKTWGYDSDDYLDEVKSRLDGEGKI